MKTTIEGPAMYEDTTLLSQDTLSLLGIDPLPPNNRHPDHATYGGDPLAVPLGSMTVDDCITFARVAAPFYKYKRLNAQISQISTVEMCQELCVELTRHAIAGCINALADYDHNRTGLALLVPFRASIPRINLLSVFDKLNRAAPLDHGLMDITGLEGDPVDDPDHRYMDTCLRIPFEKLSLKQCLVFVSCRRPFIHFARLCSQINFTVASHQHNEVRLALVRAALAGAINGIHDRLGCQIDAACMAPNFHL